VTIDEVHSRLQSWGTEIGQYHQSKGIEALPQGDLKKIVSGGYCAGAALDWIRRALLGSKLEKLSPDNPKQLYKGAIAHSQQTPEKKTAFLKTEGDKLEAEVSRRHDQINNDAQAQVDEALKKLNEFFVERAKDPAITQAEYNAECASAKAAYETTKKAILAARDEKVKANNAQMTAWNSTPTMEKFWGEFASIMDMALAKIKANKASPVKRKFTDLTIVKSVDNKEFTGVAALVEALLREPQFQGNRAAYVGINPPLKGVSGHAVAILHQNQPEDYHLFDPNFGTYKLTTEKLREAVVYIFKDAYPNIPTGNKSDNKAYEINGKIEGQYTIFEGMLKPVPTTTRPLTPTPAPTTVAPKVLAPMPTTKKPQPGPSIPVKGGSSPVTGQKPVVKTTSPAPTTGGKVSDLRRKFEQ
jgi:hypothetical protein